MPIDQHDQDTDRDTAILDEVTQAGCWLLNLIGTVVQKRSPGCS